MRVETVEVPEALRIAPDLGPGEAGAIALALQSRSSLLLLDDRPARRIARLHRIPLTGTAGIILKGKQPGLIGAVRPLLLELIDAGFYLRQDHMEMLCGMAGE